MRIGFIIGILTMLIVSIALHNLVKCEQYDNGFEAGKLYVRNAMLQQNDSILGCSRLGYIPDTISVKTELKNDGSYKIDKEK